jgi:hypothetical protein
MTSRREAGIWQSGAPLHEDEMGDLYANTGNGALNATTGDFGDCLLRLRPLRNGVDPVLNPKLSELQRIAAGRDYPMRIEVISWFSPFNQRRAEIRDLDLGVKLLGSSSVFLVITECFSGITGLNLLPDTNLAVGGSKFVCSRVLPHHVLTCCVHAGWPVCR